MATYSRFRATLDVSLSSANSPNQAHQLDLSYTGAGEYVVNQRRLVGFAGTEIIDTIVAFASGVKWMLIVNEDATNYLTLTYRSAANSTTPFSVRIPAGSAYLACDVTETTNPLLQANVANVYCQITIVGV